MTVPLLLTGNSRRAEVDGDLLEVTPLGGGSEVGRSCVIVRFRGKTIMFDCGIHPAHTGMSALPFFDNINPGEVDLLLVTHFHLDHSGAVPYLVNRTEFKGKVFMTHPTRPICRMLWHDYARVSKIAAEDQIFSSMDIDATMERIELMDYHDERQFRGIKFSCYRAGHVLGAAMFMINIGGIRVLYTGDYSQEKDRHLPQAEIPVGKVHVLIVESTYGVQNHEPREQREHRFTNSVHQVVKQGGKCLLPVFALGRAQELLLMLESYWERNSDLHGIPIYYNSPMATKCLRIFETYTNMCSTDVQEKANTGSNPWALKYIRNMPDRHSFNAQDSELGPCVVLAAPGMMQSGASRELFEAWAPDKKNGVLVTGYSVQGTLAHELKNGPESVTLQDGRKVAVRATVKFISFSAHSDYSQTSDFLKKLKSNIVVLVHGEENEMQRMRARLQEEHDDLKVCAPQNCQTVAAKVPGDRLVDALGGMAEELIDSSKRPRVDFSGVFVEDPGGARAVLDAEDLSTYTTLSTCRVEQCQRFNFPHSLAVLGRALRETYDDVEVAGGCLEVCGCVHVTLEDSVLSITWDTSPLTDLVADSVALNAIELTRNPPLAAMALEGSESEEAREARLFRVLCSFLEEEFGKLGVDEVKQTVSFEVDHSPVCVSLASRGVDCDSEALGDRVRNCLRRCETAMRPMAPF